MEYQIKDNPDNSMLYKAFPQAAARGTTVMPGNPNNVRGNMLFPYDPDPVLNKGGKSTFRGSAPLAMKEGAPVGSPADLVFKETYSSRAKQKRRFALPPQDKVAFKMDTAGVAPPNKVVFNSSPGAIEPDIIPAEANKIRIPSDNKHHVNPYIEKEGNEKMEEYHIHSNMHDHMLPPQEPPKKPWAPSEEDIVKVNGYNESNIKLLSEISSRIAMCSRAMAEINDLTRPVDAVKMMHMLERIDHNKLRNILSNAFNESLSSYLDLQSKVNAYIQGRGVVDDSDEVPVVDNTEEPSQNTSGDSVSSDDTSNSDNSEAE